MHAEDLLGHDVNGTFYIGWVCSGCGWTSKECDLISGSVSELKGRLLSLTITCSGYSECNPTSIQPIRGGAARSHALFEERFVDSRRDKDGILCELALFFGSRGIERFSGNGGSASSFEEYGEGGRSRSSAATRAAIQVCREVRSL